MWRQLQSDVRELMSCDFFELLLFTTVLSQWDLPHGRIRLLSPGKASCDRVKLPNLWCMLGVLVFQ